MSEQNPEQPNEGSENDQEQSQDTPQAPQPAEPQPVQVAPGDQSETRQDTVLGKDYEVSKERGYRRVQEEG